MTNMNEKQMTKITKQIEDLFIKTTGHSPTTIQVSKLMPSKANEGKTENEICITIKYTTK